jgi:hypothetical protein
MVKDIRNHPTFEYDPKQGVGGIKPPKAITSTGGYVLTKERVYELLEEFTSMAVSVDATLREVLKQRAVRVDDEDVTSAISVLAGTDVEPVVSYTAYLASLSSTKKESSTVTETYRAFSLSTYGDAAVLFGDIMLSFMREASRIKDYLDKTGDLSEQTLISIAQTITSMGDPVERIAMSVEVEIDESVLAEIDEYSTDELSNILKLSQSAVDHNVAIASRNLTRITTMLDGYGDHFYSTVAPKVETAAATSKTDGAVNDLIDMSSETEETERTDAVDDFSKRATVIYQSAMELIDVVDSIRSIQTIANQAITTGGVDTHPSITVTTPSSDVDNAILETNATGLAEVVAATVSVPVQIQPDTATKGDIIDTINQMIALDEFNHIRDMFVFGDKVEFDGANIKAGTIEVQALKAGTTPMSLSFRWGENMKSFHPTTGLDPDENYCLSHSSGTMSSMRDDTVRQYLVEEAEVLTDVENASLFRPSGGDRYSYNFWIYIEFDDEAGTAAVRAHQYDSNLTNKGRPSGSNIEVIGFWDTSGSIGKLYTSYGVTVINGAEIITGTLIVSQIRGTKDGTTLADDLLAIEQKADTAVSAATANDAKIQEAFDNAQTAMEAAAGYVSAYFTPDEPTIVQFPDLKYGDIWIDSDTPDTSIGKEDYGRIYRYQNATGGSTGTLAWYPAPTSAIGRAFLLAYSADAARDGAIRTYWTDEAGLAGLDPRLGDILFRTDQDNRMYRWDGSAWVDMSPAAVLARLEAVEGNYEDLYQQVSGINGTLTKVQSRVVENWYQETDPRTDVDTWPEGSDQSDDLHTGDYWFNTLIKALYRWSGTEWEIVRDQKLVDAYERASHAGAALDGYTKTFTVTPFPPYHTGDLWAGGTGSDIKVCIEDKYDLKDVRYIKDSIAGWSNGITSGQRNEWREIIAMEGETNVAIGATVTSEGIVTSTANTTNLAKIIDGNDATSFIPGEDIFNNEPQSVIIDLLSVKTLTSITIRHGFHDDDGRTYLDHRIEVSKDGATWRVIDLIPRPSTLSGTTYVHGFAEDDWVLAGGVSRGEYDSFQGEYERLRDANFYSDYKAELRLDTSQFEIGSIDAGAISLGGRNVTCEGSFYPNIAVRYANGTVEKSRGSLYFLNNGGGHVGGDNDSQSIMYILGKDGAEAPVPVYLEDVAVPNPGFTRSFGLINHTRTCVFGGDGKVSSWLRNEGATVAIAANTTYQLYAKVLCEPTLVGGKPTGTYTYLHASIKMCLANEFPPVGLTDEETPRVLASHKDLQAQTGKFYQHFRVGLWQTADDKTGLLSLRMGQTYINGDQIITGTIKAKEIDVSDGTGDLGRAPHVGNTVPAPPYYRGEIWSDTRTTPATTWICVSTRTSGEGVEDDWVKYVTAAELEAGTVTIGPGSISVVGGLPARFTEGQPYPPYKVGDMWLADVPVSYEYDESGDVVDDGYEGREAEAYPEARFWSEFVDKSTVEPHVYVDGNPISGALLNAWLAIDPNLGLYLWDYANIRLTPTDWANQTDAAKALAMIVKAAGGDTGIKVYFTTNATSTTATAYWITLNSITKSDGTPIFTWNTSDPYNNSHEFIFNWTQASGYSSITALRKTVSNANPGINIRRDQLGTAYTAMIAAGVHAIPDIDIFRTLDICKYEEFINPVNGMSIHLKGCSTSGSIGFYDTSTSLTEANSEMRCWLFPKGDKDFYLQHSLEGVKLHFTADNKIKVITTQTTFANYPAGTEVTVGTFQRDRWIQLRMVFSIANRYFTLMKRYDGPQNPWVYLSYQGEGWNGNLPMYNAGKTVGGKKGTDLGGAGTYVGTGGLYLDIPPECELYLGHVRFEQGTGIIDTARQIPAGKRTYICVIPKYEGETFDILDWEMQVGADQVFIPGRTVIDGGFIDTNTVQARTFRSGRNNEHHIEIKDTRDSEYGDEVVWYQANGVTPYAGVYAADGSLDNKGDELKLWYRNSYIRIKDTTDKTGDDIELISSGEITLESLNITPVIKSYENPDRTGIEWRNGLRPALDWQRFRDVNASYSGAPLQAGWVEDTATHFAAAYCKDAAGNVHLRGKIAPTDKTTTPSSTSFICQLPKGYRPSRKMSFPVRCNNQILAGVDIFSDGKMYLYAPSAIDFFAIDGITFRPPAATTILEERSDITYTSYTRTYNAVTGVISSYYDEANTLSTDPYMSIGDTIANAIERRRVLLTGSSTMFSDIRQTAGTIIQEVNLNIRQAAGGAGSTDSTNPNQLEVRNMTRAWTKASLWPTVSGAWVSAQSASLTVNWTTVNTWLSIVDSVSDLGGSGLKGLGMVADLQNYCNGYPFYGWMLTIPNWEVKNATPHIRLDSDSSLTPANRPTISITYKVPSST